MSDLRRHRRAVEGERPTGAWRPPPRGAWSRLAWLCLAVLVVNAGCSTGNGRVWGPAQLGDVLIVPADKTLQVQELRGELSDRDGLRPNGQLMDCYLVFFRRQEEIRIELRSDELDSYLIIYDVTGRLVAEDDDSSSGLDARIRMVAPDEGFYWVVVSSYSRGEGEYRLIIERPVATVRHELTEWPGVLRGRFDESSPRDARGRPYRVMALEIPAGHTLNAAMASQDCEPQLRLYDELSIELTARGERATGGAGRLTYTAEGPARVYLVATTRYPLDPTRSATFEIRMDE